MPVVTAVLPAGTFAPAAAIDSVTLSAAARAELPHCVDTPGGLHLHFHLHDAPVLQEGDGLQLQDGRIILVAARGERVAEIHVASPAALAAAAWTLGRRQIAMEVTATGLRIRDDLITVEELKKLPGVEVKLVEAPFQPGTAVKSGDGHDHGDHHHHHDHDHHHGHDHHDHDHGHAANDDVDAAELAAAMARREARKAAREAVPHVHGPGCGHEGHDHDHDHDHGHDHKH